MALLQKNYLSKKVLASEFTLNLASLKATQITYTKHTNQPNLSNVLQFPKIHYKCWRYSKTNYMSASESNSFPILEVPLINLAILPSRASIKPAKILLLLQLQIFHL